MYKELYALIDLPVTFDETTLSSRAALCDYLMRYCKSLFVLIILVGYSFVNFKISIEQEFAIYSIIYQWRFGLVFDIKFTFAITFDTKDIEIK